MTYHGMQCAVCDRTLMQGGNEDQRPRWVQIDERGERMTASEIAQASWDENDHPVYEARCRQCAGKETPNA